MIMLIIDSLLESFVKDLDHVKISIIDEIFRIEKGSLVIDLDLKKDINVQFESYIKNNGDRILESLETLDGADGQVRKWLEDNKGTNIISEALINLGKALPKSFSELLEGVKIRSSSGEVGEREVIFGILLDDSKYVFSFTCKYNEIILDGMDHIKNVLKGSLTQINIEDLKSTRFLDWLESEGIISRAINVNLD